MIYRRIIKDNLRLDEVDLATKKKKKDLMRWIKKWLARLIRRVGGKEEDNKLRK